MRVLCTATGAASHARALLPLTRALAGAGHEVTLVTTDVIAPFFAAEKMVVHASMPLLPPPPSVSDRTVGVDAEVRFRLRTAQLTGSYAYETLRVLRAVTRGKDPELILRHGIDLGACLLAEELGVPHLPVPSGFVNMLDPASVLTALNDGRDRLGLPTQEDPASLYPYGRLDYLPPSLSFARTPVPVLAYRQSLPLDPAALPAWVTRLPADRPLVFASVGMALPLLHHRAPEGRMPPGVTDPTAQLRTVVAALSLLDVNAIVVTGGIRLDGAEAGPGIHLTDRLPQPLLLECADLLVTHGGYKSVSEAIRTATPMAVFPNFADQPHNAERVQELGFGRRLDHPAPSTLAQTCQEILEDRDAAVRLRAARLAVLGLPDISHAPSDLEDIATNPHRRRLADTRTPPDCGYLDRRPKAEL
ncbi:glycosyltransferase [Streptomyces rubiginosohelvolus]|uniref:glycosyltransferase n=1 Tax=Streptomyces rubiginosohelvolus TaxID=67362 RepID=UPI003806D399